MKDECYIVRDLLSLYAEDMLSDETAQFVANHLENCPECKTELDGLSAEIPAVSDVSTMSTLSKAATADGQQSETEAKPFKRIMSRMNRQLNSLCSLIVIFLIVLGYVWTGGEKLMNNSIVMPVVGVVGYIAFGWRSVYKVPILLIITDLFVLITGITEELDLLSTAMWTCILLPFVFAGIAIAFLLHFAFKKGMFKKVKALKIPAAVVATGLIAWVCLFSNGLVGNPVSKILAERTAREYIKTQFPDTDYELEELGFSFKSGDYYAHIKSPSSEDSSFTLSIRQNGKLRYSDYDSRVTERRNTADRIMMDYRKAVERIVDGIAFPYNCSIGYGELQFISLADRENPDYADYPEYGLITDTLTLDGYYNLAKLGAQAGKLTLHIKDDEVSVERLSEILLGIRQTFDDAGVSFHVIDCILEKKPDENGDYPEGRVEVMDMLYSDIHEEGLVERVRILNEKAIEYWAEEDEEKADWQ